MSSWFDDWDREVREAVQNDPRESQFFGRMKEIEAVRLRTINLVTGDREFPDEWRERIQRIIAVYSVSTGHPSDTAIAHALTMGYSKLSQESHSVFHEIADARIETRFGLLSDSPSDILTRRDEHDAEQANGLGVNE